jgi:hypothetical protein
MHSNVTGSMHGRLRGHAALGVAFSNGVAVRGVRGVKQTMHAMTYASQAIEGWPTRVLGCHPWRAQPPPRGAQVWPPRTRGSPP